MKETVDLNNNGLSIESTHKVLHRGKWVKRYIMCRKHTDLNDPILFIYKNKKEKQRNSYKFSLVLNNYVGYECGFEFKKRRNTLSLITAEVCLMMSFDLAESLVVWEAWLKNICGQTISFYMQLKKIPPSWKCTHALLKEVRCHVKEGQLGVVYGRPQELLTLIDLRHHRIDVEDNNLISIWYGNEKPDDKVVLLCPKSPHFKKCLGAARIEGALPKLLNREQFEGDWMPREEKKRSFGDHTSQFTVNMSDLASLMRTPEPQHSHRINQKLILPKGISKSGYFPPGYYNNGSADYENLPYRPVSRANSTAAYCNIIPNHNRGNNPKPIVNSSSVHYVNIGPSYYSNGRRYSENEREVLSAKTSVPSTRSVDDHPVYCNIIYNGAYPEEHEYVDVNNGLRCYSMPEYVNVQIYHGVPHVVEETDPDQDWYENQDVIRRQSDNSVQSHQAFPSTSRGIANNRGRSNPDFQTRQSPEESKHENWRKAKKFFSAFKLKSQNDLKNNTRQKNIQKSSSTGALHFSNSFHRGSSSSETDDNPPALNVSCHQMTRSQPMLSGLSHPPPQGLVQAPSDIVLMKSRSGVGAILARRKIRGSFTKYDGERGTHMYQGQQTSIPKEDSIKEEEEPKEPEKPKPAPPRPPKIGKMVDGIASAVSRGQEKLKMTDRRASNINLDGLPEGGVVSAGSSRPTSRAETARSEPDTKNHLTTLPLPLSPNSNSHSDITRSSTESLSSDARSRISIRKKRNSPPRVTAPKLASDGTYVHLEPHVICLVPSSSVESCHSEQTARSFSPRPNNTRTGRNNVSQHSLASAASHKTIFGNYIELPMQPPSSDSNSSMASKHSTDYIVIDPVTTQAIHTTNTQMPLERSLAKSTSMTGVPIVRRQSQGQGSSNSDSLSLDHSPRQGFFKKYRKVRRSKRIPGGSSSMTQLNV